MYDAHVTLQGWAGGDATFHQTDRGSFAKFRVGCTPRFYSRGRFRDGETSWYTVTCWRRLGEHVAESVRKGDALVVWGKLRADVWNRDDGSTQVSYLVDATAVGHDLNRGTSRFARAAPRASVDAADDAAAHEIVHQVPKAEPQLDSDGNPVLEPEPSPGAEPSPADPTAA